MNPSCRRLLFVTLALVSATVFPACRKKAQPDESVIEQPREPVRITGPLYYEPEALDPGFAFGAAEGAVVFNLFEGLLMPAPTTDVKDSKDLVVPGVAKDFEVSADGLTYTFKLRADAKWSNGDPLTSEDFVYSWRRVLDPKKPADYAVLFWEIEGARDYYDGKETDWSKVGIKAPDAQTLVVKLNTPTPYFPELVSFYTFFPVPKKAIEAHGDDWTKPENIITNGAYRLASRTPDEEVVLEKSENYWDAANVKIDTVTLRVIRDQVAMLEAYQNKEIDWMLGSFVEDVAEKISEHPDKVNQALLGTYYYRVNVTANKALADPRVRRALSLAIDREALLTGSQRRHRPTATMVPPSLVGYESVAKVTDAYNPEEARKLLTEAGYSDAKPLEITLLYNTDENHKAIAETVKSMWSLALGVRVEIVNKEWRQYLQDVDMLSYGVARAGWIGDYNDPLTFLGMWVTGDANNDTGWSNPEYDTLIARAKSELDVDKRRAILAQAEMLLLEQGPVIPLYTYHSEWLIHPKLKASFREQSREIHQFKHWRVELY